MGKFNKIPATSTVKFKYLSKRHYLMGRIKTAMVKRATHALMKQEISFNSEFSHNKKLLKDTMPSKKVRNKIAGYIARLNRNKKE